MSDPSHQIVDFLITRLSAVNGLSAIASLDQIREASDQSDPKCGDAAIVVSAVDSGNHLGIPGRILVDVAASVELRTALSVDLDLTLFDAYAAEIMQSLSAIANNTAITGWTIRKGDEWQSGEVAQDSMYRYQEWKSNFLLQVIEATTTSTTGN